MEEICEIKTTPNKKAKISLVLVGLPNLLNGLIAESPIGEELTQAYFLDWLDLEILARSVNPDPSRTIRIWVFYSMRAMGLGGARIEPEELTKFIKMQNRIPGITATDVGIPGEQNEFFYFKCSKCGEPNEVQTLLEKGIDTTLIILLFDTMDSWEAATIISQDADFCPAFRGLEKGGSWYMAAGFPKGPRRRLSGSVLNKRTFENAS